MKVLLVTPAFTQPGGVSDFNRLLLKYSKSNITTFILSTAGKEKGRLIRLYYGFGDVIRYIKALLIGKYDIVHLNPSLGKNAIKRDSFLTFIAKVMGKRVYIHWHGWNPSNEFLLHGRNRLFLKRTLFLADHIKLLSPKFKNVLLNCGYNKTTSIGNTFIDDDFYYQHGKRRKHKDSINILFLSTVSRNKGIYSALDLYKTLIVNYPQVTLSIAGIGPEIEGVKNIVESIGNKKVKFLGYVLGTDKESAFNNADIFLLPSYYEGMPIVVLEAMAFGLPVVCSAVGALPDFFIDQKMGFLIQNQNMESYYSALELLVVDSSLRSEIGMFNRAYVKDHFLASKTVSQIDQDYLSMLNY